MKTLLIICLSLSVLTGELRPNEYHALRHKAYSLRMHWLKKSRKGVLRNSANIYYIPTAIRNSLHLLSAVLLAANHCFKLF